MKKDIEHLNLNIIGLLAEGEKQYYIDENIYLAMSAMNFGGKHLQFGQPYRVEEGRLLCITQGWTRCLVNMVEYLLEPQTLLAITPDSIFEIIEYSQDLDMMAFSMKDLPSEALLSQPVELQMDDDEWLLIGEYFRLLWHEVHRQPVSLPILTHLQTAMMLEVKRIGMQQEPLREQKATKSETLLHRFLHLINIYGLRERKIDFYADQLCVTPNYLSSVIKKASGLTVLQWLNRYAIQQAKILLKYSDLPAWEIAEQMNFANPSFFSKFFKKETGMTPLAYRNG